MPRVRLSTTVDGTTLARARTLVRTNDSQLLDRALALLVDRLEADHEAAALDRFPYDTDPTLAWQAPSGPDLPFDGKVPPEVADLVRRRRDTRDA